MNYFDYHGPISLIFLAIFPRITLLVGGFLTGGFMWWLGWLFAPHFLVAILSIQFWDSNPVLCIIAWILAFSGTNIEYRYINSSK